MWGGLTQLWGGLRGGNPTDSVFCDKIYNFWEKKKKFELICCYLFVFELSKAGTCNKRFALSLFVSFNDTFKVKVKPTLDKIYSRVWVEPTQALNIVSWAEPEKLELLAWDSSKKAISVCCASLNIGSQALVETLHDEVWLDLDVYGLNTNTGIIMPIPTGQEHI